VAPTVSTIESCREVRPVAGLCLPQERPHRRRELLGWLLTAVCVVFVLLAANHRMLRGKSTGGCDAELFFCPYYMLMADSLRHGELLLWTPLAGGGYPAGIDPQVGAFSPLKIAVAAITGGHEWGFRAYWLAIWAMGGLGILVLARHFAAPRWLGFVAALAFMFSGIYTGHAEHTSFLEVICLFPWVLWRADVGIRRGSLLACAQAGALWGLSALAGYPGMAVLAAFYVSLWWLGRTLSGDTLDSATPAAGQGSAERSTGWITPLRRARGLCAAQAVFLVVGAAVASPAYVGFMIETRGYSQRCDKLPRELAIGSNALQPGALATFASPYFAATKFTTHPELWPETDPSTCSIYLFPGVLALAAASLSFQRRKRFHWYLACLAVFFLLSAMGSALPLRGWLYDLLPPMRFFRHAGIFRCFSMITLLLLALLAGCDLALATERQGTAFWRRVSIAGAILAVAAVAAFTRVCRAIPVAATDLGNYHHWTLSVAHLILVFFGTATIAGIAWWRPGTARRRCAWLLLPVLAIADAALSIEVSKSLVYSPCSKWDAAQSKHRPSMDLSHCGLARQRVLGDFVSVFSDNKNLVTKTPVLFSYTPLTSACFMRIAQDPLLAQSATGSERIWFARRAVELPWTDQAVSLLLERSAKLHAPCLVITSPRQAGSANSAAAITPQMQQSCRELPAAERVSVKLAKYTPREMAFDVTCPADGWLLVTDRWAPGWSVQVNGQPQEVLLGNLVFRAVATKAGANHVDFRYRPFGYPWLLLLGWGTLTAVGIAPVLVSARAKRHQHAGVLPKHGRAASEAMPNDMEFSADPPSDAELLEVAVLVPIYNDWDSARTLVERLDGLIAGHTVRMRVILVDDGSSMTPPESPLDLDLENLTSLAVLRLRRNVGHQRAIAIGLTHVYEKQPCDAVVVMDGDGEDRPEDVLRLIAAFREGGAGKAVFAARAKRSEGLAFRLGYLGFRVLHRLATGRGVRVGNFSILPYRYLAALVVSSDLWNHYAAAVVKSKLPCLLLPTARGTRWYGSSRMNFVSLLIHGLSAISVFGELVGTRAALACVAASTTMVLLITAVVVGRMFFNPVYVGWGTLFVTLLLLLLLLGQFLTATVSFLLNVLSTRNGATFLPLRDYQFYIEHMRQREFSATCQSPELPAVHAA
jgi:hypothetical protein